MGRRLSRKPADVLAREGFTVRTVVNRLVRILQDADVAAVADGAVWYADGQAAAVAVGEAYVARTGADVAPVRAGAAILAAISPRTRWARNLTGAFQYATTGDAPGVVMVTHRPNLWRVECAVAAGTDPTLALQGPKVRSFAANLSGDLGRVTVDVWAIRAALGPDCEDPEAVLARTGVYDAVAHCYALAAARVGLEPAVAQAVVWVAVRGRAS